MKEINEFINLRLHSLNQALTVIDCLFDNGYSYRNYSEEKSIRDTVRKDINRMFKGKPNSKKWYQIYFVEIDNEIKDFVICTKNIDIVDVRKDKLKKIKNGLQKTERRSKG